MTAVDGAIGLFDPMSPSTLKDPGEGYRALRDHAPVAHLAPLDVWVVSRYDDVRRILGSPEAFSAALAFGRDAPIVDPRGEPPRRINLRFSGDAGGVVSATDGDDHARLRRMVAPTLSKRRLAAAEAGVAEHVRTVVAGLAAAAREFDVVTDLARPVAASAIGGLMGLDGAVVGALSAWVDLTARALDPGDELSGEAAAPQVLRANLSCMRAVARGLDAAVRASAPGTGEALVEAWRPARTPAARKEVVLSVLQLFQAGYETIVSAICSLLARFVLDRAHPDLPPTSSPAFTGLVEEGLRLGAPVRATFRGTVGPQAVGGVELPDGAMVMVLLASANRDERAFERPDEALPGRSRSHLAFGAGPHRCLGRFLAHMELTHVLEALVAAATVIETAGPARISANILKAGHDSLPVRAAWRRA